jgi:hypothetical protein
MEFIQFKLDVNEQTDCTSFNRLNDTDVTTGNHILKACEVDTIECFDTCMAYSGRRRSMYQCGLQGASMLAQNVVTADTSVYAKDFTTIYPCDN